MRIPDWTPQEHPQDPALVQQVLTRRGGQLLNLDKALLWSAPVTTGWHAYFQHVRHGLSVSRKLSELGICTVALLTGAHYEYHHHAPDFIKAGGTEEELAALQQAVHNAPCQGVTSPVLGPLNSVVVQYAAQMTLNIEIDDAVFTALRSHLSTTEVVELSTVIASYNMVARLLVALQIQPET